jgi:hypothetical protein
VARQEQPIGKKGNLRVQGGEVLMRIIYFGVQPRLPGRAPTTLLHAEEHDELFLGPHVRLTSFDGMACIESESLAHQYAEGCTLILQKRYGEDTTLEVISCREREGKKLAERISRDSAIVRTRIATNNFVPNRSPL